MPINKEDIIQFDIDNDIQRLENSLKLQENIFNEVYDHYNKVKRSNALTFIEKQTSNIASMLNNQTSTINNIINAKRLKSEISIKVAKETSQENVSNDNLEQMMNSMYNVILNNKNKSLDDIIIENKEDDIDEELNKILLERELEEKENGQVVEPEEIEEEIEELVSNEDEELTIIFVEDTKELIAINTRGYVVENNDLNLSEIAIINVIDGFAIDTEGNKYQTIESL